MDGILGLAHVGVFVRDLEVSKKFYRDILGFEIIWECEVGTDHVAFAKKGDLCLELVMLANAPCRGDGVVDHIAMRVKNIEAVRDALLDKGIVFETDDVVFNDRVFPNGSKWILFRGPDGEHLELTEVL